MQQLNNKIALIPAYEPSDMLVELSKNMNTLGFEVIIIDDGSTSSFAPIFKSASDYATVLTHKSNRGKGRALKTGLSYIWKHFTDITTIVTLDADGQHRVEDVIHVWQAASVSDYCLFLGSRSFDGNVPTKSKFGNTVTRFIYRISTGVPVYDTQTGLRAFGMKLIPFMLDVEGERYEYEINVLLECTRKNIPIKEIGIETIYFKNNTATHFNMVRDSLLIYSNILKFAASSLTCFIIDFGIYSLMVFLTQGLSMISVPLSNIVARVISSALNYSINKRHVFKNKDCMIKTATWYFALAACILAGNTIILSFIVDQLSFNPIGGKFLTEVTLFSLSWLIQRFVIFKKEDAHHAKHSRGVKHV